MANILNFHGHKIRKKAYLSVEKNCNILVNVSLLIMLIIPLCSYLFCVCLTSLLF